MKEDTGTGQPVIPEAQFDCVIYFMHTAVELHILT